MLFKNSLRDLLALISSIWPLPSEADAVAINHHLAGYWDHALPGPALNNLSAHFFALFFYRAQKSYTKSAFCCEGPTKSTTRCEILGSTWWPDSEIKCSVVQGNDLPSLSPSQDRWRNWLTRRIDRIHVARISWHSLLDRKLKQWLSENDGRSNVNDCSEFKTVSNWCYPNCCSINCGHLVKLSNLPSNQTNSYLKSDDSCILVYLYTDIPMY